MDTIAWNTCCGRTYNSCCHTSSQTTIPTLTPSAAPLPSATTTPSATPTAVPTLELPTPTAALAPLAAEERERIFEQVWNLVNRRYLYTDYRGLIGQQFALSMPQK